MATTQPKTLQEAIKYYSDLDVCQALMVNVRWPDGVACPHCHSRRVHYLETRRIWECKSGQHKAKRQFSAKVGTIFEDSPIGLDKWFTAIWLITNAKNGISSYELHRSIGVTQKTAWFMLHRVRLAMQTRSFRQLAGCVEVDETFIGGKARNMHRGKREIRIKGRGGIGKVVVLGLLHRHGQVRAEVIQERNADTLHGAIRKNVMPQSEVFTDELAAYDGLNREYAHRVINHAERYVDGQVHTNGMENFWSLLKRGINGTYVSVEPFHLFRYLDEQVYRFNNRKTTDADRFAGVLGSMAGRRLTYKDLIGEQAA